MNNQPINIFFNKVKNIPKIFFLIFFLYVLFFCYLLITSGNLFVVDGYVYKFPVLDSDSLEYAILGKNLIELKKFTLGSQTNFLKESFRTPGYPFFIAIILYFFDSFVFIALIQILLTFLSAYLIYLITQRLNLSNVKGIICALFYLIDPNVIFHSYVILSEVLFNFLFLLSVYLFFFSPMANKNLNFFIVGILMGAATLTRPILIFILPIWSIFFFLPQKSRYSLNDILKFLFIIWIGYSVIVVPWMVRNKLDFGKFSLTSLTAYNLFHYNIPIFLASETNGSASKISEEMYKELKITPQEAKDLSNSDKLNNYNRSFFAKNFFPYLKFHLIKTTPFFLNSGFRNFVITNNIFKDYFLRTGQLEGGNFTDLVLKKDYLGVLNFVKKKWIFSLEGLFWLSMLLISILTPFFVKEHKWVMLMFLIMILYFALLTGPVSYSRYRMPAEPFLLILGIGGLSFLIEKLRRLKVFMTRESKI